MSTSRAHGRNWAPVVIGLLLTALMNSAAAAQTVQETLFFLMKNTEDHKNVKPPPGWENMKITINDKDCTWNEELSRKIRGTSCYIRHLSSARELLSDRCNPNSVADIDGWETSQEIVRFSRLLPQEVSSGYNSSFKAWVIELRGLEDFACNTEEKSVIARKGNEASWCASPDWSRPVTLRDQQDLAKSPERCVRKKESCNTFTNLVSFDRIEYERKLKALVYLQSVCSTGKRRGAF